MGDEEKLEHSGVLRPDRSKGRVMGFHFVHGFRLAVARRVAMGDFYGQSALGWRAKYCGNDPHGFNFTAHSIPAGAFHPKLTGFKMKPLNLLKHVLGPDHRVL